MTDALSKAERMLDEADCKESDKASKLMRKALWRPFETYALLPYQGNQPPPLGTEKTVTDTLNVQVLKVKTSRQERTCHENRQN